MSLYENADSGSFHDSEDIEMPGCFAGDIRRGSSHSNGDIETPDFFEENCNEVSLQDLSALSDAALGLSRNFVRLDATQLFARTWEPTFIAWTTLLSITQIPPSVPLTVDSLAPAVRALDGVISGKDDPYLPPRFGHVQLFHFLGSLKSRIERDKKCGLIEAKIHVTNAAIAYELYRNAQDKPATTSRLRRLRLIGNRWKDAVGSSPFLLLAFSKTAESIAKYPSKADNKTFRSLVLKASNDILEELKNVCYELSIIAEQEAANNSSPDDILKNGLRDGVKDCLLTPK